MKMGSWKRVLSLMIAALLLAAIFPLGMVYANEEPPPALEDVNTAVPPEGHDPLDFPDEGEVGFVRMTKGARWTNEEKTEAEIVFNVWGTQGKYIKGSR